MELRKQFRHCDRGPRQTILARVSVKFALVPTMAISHYQPTRSDYAQRTESR